MDVNAWKFTRGREQQFLLLTRAGQPPGGGQFLGGGLLQLGEGLSTEGLSPDPRRLRAKSPPSSISQHYDCWGQPWFITIIVHISAHYVS